MTSAHCREGKEAPIDTTRRPQNTLVYLPPKLIDIGRKQCLAKLLVLLCCSLSLWLSSLLRWELSPAAAQETGPQWCAGKTIRFFVGGAEGDAFASIVLRGAQAAEADLGPTVEYVFSGWDVEKMTQQLREAIAAQPDGIAMMGHPGDAAIMPLAEEAAAAGIKMMYQNVDVPTVRAKYGGGYVGANLGPQGRALGEEAVRQFGLGAGDAAIVFVPLGQPGRDLRELSTAQALEDAGLTRHQAGLSAGMGVGPEPGAPVADCRACWITPMSS